MIALPILVMLLISVSAVFMFCMRAYFANLADGELVQEVQMAFSRVVEDALAGKSIEEISSQREGLEIVSRQNLLYRDSQPGKLVKESYWLHHMASLRKLVRSSADAPLTGDHTLARVTIVEFSAVKDEAYPHVYRIRLTGKSEMTKHEYTICTAVYLPQS